MRQEINLYTEEFKPKMLWCSFGHAVFVSVLFVAALGVYSTHQYDLYSSLKKENSILAVENQVLEEGSQSKNLMDRMVEKRQLVEEQVSRLAAEVDSKKKIKGAYESQRPMSLASFYHVFVTIAKQANSNLSVSEVGIHNGGEEVLLNGMSRTREDIPAYFQRLKKEDSFSLASFGLLTIERVKEVGFYQFLMKRKSEYLEGEEFDESKESVLNKANVDNG